MRPTTATAVGACVVASLLSGCSGTGTGSAGGDVEGGTFALAVTADPGNLDPQGSAGSELVQISRFAYDPLLHLDAQGQLSSGLAGEWAVDGQQVSLTLKDGITCADGSPFTAADVVDNVAHVADPANESPFLGVYLPVGASASAGDGGAVTITLASPAPFVLEGLASLPMVCRSGLDDRASLATQTAGTGPYQLTEAASGDRYTYTRREGYTWGPGGAGTDTAGLPETIVARIVANETTAANLLLSGELSAAQIIGPDAQRLRGAGLFTTETATLLGEMWFNHAPSRPGSDPAVRAALTQALDLGQLASVLTSDQGGPATAFAVAPPAACPGDSVSGALPSSDPAAAAQLLDGAGWVAGADGKRSRAGAPLSLVFVYGTELGSGGAAAAELATAAWTELGAAVDVRPQDETAAVDTLFTTGDWDISWTQLNVSSPDQLVPFLSGPAVPDGNNFAQIDNAAYTAGVAQASAVPGAQGCETWLAAEANLVRDADVVPFANRLVPTFGKGATFEIADVIQPTSITMVAG